MGLSSDLISQFVKATNDSIKREKETIIAYGTTVVREDTIYVKLDGSDLLTPVTSTVNVRNNDRVTVMIKNHTATVTGNITSPSAGTEDIADAGKTATDYMTVTDAHGLVIGSKPDGILHGNIQNLVVHPYLFAMEIRFFRNFHLQKKRLMELPLHRRLMILLLSRQRTRMDRQ